MSPDPASAPSPPDAPAPLTSPEPPKPGRAPAPPWLPLLLLPLAALLFRVAYHAHRAVFGITLSELGVTPVQIGSALAFGEALAIAGYGLGAALSAYRPPAAAFMGGLLLLLGLGWFAADPGSWTSCEMLLRLGLGCFQVGAFAVVVVASTGFRQRVVGIAALLGMAALGGFLGPMLGGVAFASSKNSGASLPALISLLVVGVVGVLSTSPHGNTSKAKPSASSGQRAGLTALLVAVGALSSVLFTLTQNAPYQADPGVGFNFLMLSGPRLLGALVVLLVGALLAQTSWDRVRLFALSLGLCAVAALVSAHAAPLELNANLLASVALGGFAEAISATLLFAVLFGVWPRRRAGVVFFGFTLVTGFFQGRAWFALNFSGDVAAVLAKWGMALGLLAIVVSVACYVFAPRIEALLRSASSDPA